MNVIKGRLKEAKDKQKSYADMHRVDKSCIVGDKVFFKLDNKRAPLNFGEEISCLHVVFHHYILYPSHSIDLNHLYMLDKSRGLIYEQIYILDRHT